MPGRTTSCMRRRRTVAKTHQEIMEILEAFDLTRSYRAAAQLAGSDHKTVAHYVERRDAGYDPCRRARRSRLVDT